MLTDGVSGHITSPRNTRTILLVSILKKEFVEYNDLPDQRIVLVDEPTHILGGLMVYHSLN